MKALVQKILFEMPFTEKDKEMVEFYKIGLARAVAGDYRAKNTTLLLDFPTVEKVYWLRHFPEHLRNTLGISMVLHWYIIHAVEVIVQSRCLGSFQTP
jgi:hypothetical protein